ncbi:MAG: YfdX family protein [Gammaproteobacteria bacterium]|nr:YfdX family protein [Gammaproteobacteria bacterium]
MNTLFRLKPVTVALMAALVASGPVLANEAIQEELTVSPGRQISPQDEVTISATAVKVLRHIAAARGELTGDKPDSSKAKLELEQSNRLLDIIQAALPTTKVKDRIWVARKHLEYENTDEVLPDLVPIYVSLDELVDYMPTAKAKDHLDNAKQALKDGDKPKASEHLQAVDDALLYVEADLPLSSTRVLVEQARAALDKTDVKAADQALAAAEDNIVFVSLSFESPLTQAKAALFRAQQNYALGEKAFAKADLDAAVVFLERAAQSEDKVVRDATNALVSEVRGLNSLIDTNSQDFSVKTEHAWHRVKALSERSAESISTGWQRFRAEGAGKKDLIEAKLQLAFARIDRFIASDDAAAGIELAEAKSYLDAAANQVPAEQQAEVQGIASQVDRLENAVNSGDKSHADVQAFNQTESHIAKLIHRL